jgi:hypothetical protein
LRDGPDRSNGLRAILYGTRTATNELSGRSLSATYRTVPALITVVSGGAARITRSLSTWSCGDHPLKTRARKPPALSVIARPSWSNEMPARRWARAQHLRWRWRRTRRDGRCAHKQAAIRPHGEPNPRHSLALHGDLFNASPLTKQGSAAMRPHDLNPAHKGQDALSAATRVRKGEFTY